MTPSQLALTMKRNDDPLRIQFNITEDGVPVNMEVDYAAKLQVRPYAGAADPALLTLTQVATAAGSVINLNATGFELVIFKADVQAADGFVTGLAEGTPWVGSYDIVVTEPGGDANPWYVGAFTLEEGVTVA